MITVNFIIYLVIFLLSTYGVRMLKDIPSPECFLAFKFIGALSILGMVSSIAVTLPGA